VSQQPNDELDAAIARMVSAGLDHASTDELLQQLNDELEQQVNNPIALDAASEPWVYGDDPVALDASAAEQPAGMARRFLGYYGAALKRELCDAEGGCLKEGYRKQLSGQDLKTNLAALAPTVLATIGASVALVAPAVVAAIVAVWLLRVGLEQWCAAGAGLGATTDTQAAS
jgi:hypothetical protein